MAGNTFCEVDSRHRSDFSTSVFYNSTVFELFSAQGQSSLDVGTLPECVQFCERFSSVFGSVFHLAKRFSTLVIGRPTLV